MARPRKPIAQKLLEGTYRADRDGAQREAESALQAIPSVILPSGATVSCPKSIRTKYVRAYWRRLTAMLIDLQVLSPADLPQLETMCVVLEKLREVQAVWSEATPLDEGYDKLQKMYIALSNKFDTLAAKYYISPDARLKLKIDSLAVMKGAQDVMRGASAISALLDEREGE